MLAIMLAKNDSASHAGKDRISLSCWQRTQPTLVTFPDFPGYSKFPNECRRSRAAHV